MFDCVHFAGAANACLYFVSDENDVVFAAKFFGCSHEFLCGDFDAFALDGFDDKRGYVAIF